MYKIRVDRTLSRMPRGEWTTLVCGTSEFTLVALYRLSFCMTWGEKRIKNDPSLSHTNPPCPRGWGNNFKIFFLLFIWNSLPNTSIETKKKAVCVGSKDLPKIHALHLESRHLSKTHRNQYLVSCRTLLFSRTKIEATRQVTCQKYCYHDICALCCLILERHRDGGNGKWERATEWARTDLISNWSAFHYVPGPYKSR